MRCRPLQPVTTHHNRNLINDRLPKCCIGAFDSQVTIMASKSNARSAGVAGLHGVLIMAEIFGAKSQPIHIFPSKRAHPGLSNSCIVLASCR